MKLPPEIRHIILAHAVKGTIVYLDMPEASNISPSPQKEIPVEYDFQTLSRVQYINRESRQFVQSTKDKQTLLYLRLDSGLGSCPRFPDVREPEWNSKCFDFAVEWPIETSRESLDALHQVFDRLDLGRHDRRYIAAPQVTFQGMRWPRCPSNSSLISIPL